MTLELPEDLEIRLEKVAKNLNVTKQYCIEMVLSQYVANWEKINEKSSSQKS
jgi:predicted transcriptional regulator